MARSEGRGFSDYAPEADVIEQRRTAQADDQDPWQAPGLSDARESDANEADLIEQAIEVPDDESDFDR